MYFTPKKSKMHLESLSLCYELASCLSSSSLAKHLLHQCAQSNWFWTSRTRLLDTDQAPAWVFQKIYFKRFFKAANSIAFKINKRNTYIERPDLPSVGLALQTQWSEQILKQIFMHFIFSSVWDSETFILVRHEKLHENRTVFSRKPF